MLIFNFVGKWSESKKNYIPKSIVKLLSGLRVPDANMMDRGFKLTRDCIAIAALKHQKFSFIFLTVFGVDPLRTTVFSI
jgi:hypothetical protein